MKLTVTTLPNTHERGDTLLVSLVALGLFAAVGLGFTQCSDELLLRARETERIARVDRFIHYVKNATDCRQTIIMAGGCVSGAPLTLYTHTGLPVMPNAAWPDFDVPEATCVRETTAAAASDRRPQYLPFRQRYDNTSSPPAPGAIGQQYVRWDLWFTLKVKYLGIAPNLLSAPRTKIVHFYDNVDPEKSQPWICDDGVSL